MELKTALAACVILTIVCAVIFSGQKYYVKDGVSLPVPKGWEIYEDSDKYWVSDRVISLTSQGSGNLSLLQ